MNTAEIKNLVNDLELRCTNCAGNVSIIEIVDVENIVFKHNLPIPGAKVKSGETKCMFFDGEIRKQTKSFINGEINASTFRENLIELARTN